VELRYVRLLRRKGAAQVPRKNGAKATVCITGNEVRSHFGETKTGSDSRLIEFVEKPSSSHVNIGVYVLKQRSYPA